MQHLHLNLHHVYVAMEVCITILYDQTIRSMEDCI